MRSKLRDRSAILIACTSAGAAASALAFNAVISDTSDGSRADAAIIVSLSATAVAALSALLSWWSVSRRWPEKAALNQILLSLRESNAANQPMLDTHIAITQPAGESSQVGSRLLLASNFTTDSSNHSKNTVVLGERGSGKTTLLLQLALSMAEQSSQHRSGFLPILLDGGQWKSGNVLSSWVSTQAERVYGLPTSLTREYFRRGRIVLLLDVSENASSLINISLVQALNQWSKNRTSARVFVACDASAYATSFCKLQHARIVHLQPLTRREMDVFLTRQITNHLSVDPDRAQAIVRRIVERLNAGNHGVVTPLMARLLASSQLVSDNESFELSSADDSSVAAIHQADLYRSNGDVSGALKIYSEVFADRNSQLRAVAGVRSMSLLAQQGNYDDAAQMLRRAIQLEQEKTLGESLVSVRNMLDEPERLVFDALEKGVSLDVFQISSATALTPSKSQRALNTLTHRGLVELVLEGDTERFRRSLIELADN